MHGARIGVDVGGTFTDLVVLEEGRLRTAKVPSTPQDQAQGALAAVAAAGIDPTGVAAFAHGMTVATNALLERRGARTAFVVTEGFHDLLEIGRQNRADLYDLTARGPAPLVPRELVFSLRERMGPQGVVTALDEAALATLVADLAAAKVESVAVCLLFSFLHPEHEERVGAALRAALPDLPIALSSEVLPELREYERASTTAATAYLSPLLQRYLRRLRDGVRAAGMPDPLVMHSGGGLLEIAAASEHAAACVLSGPAGGVIGAAKVAAQGGFHDVLAFDMGGTSTDVAAIRDGRAQTTTESIVAGVPLRLPMVDVHTVAAGGGSIARIDEGGLLHVGPHSAGAEPGPAAYGRGGVEATVTDAHVVLGALADGAVLGGSITLDRAAAARAIEPIAAALGLSLEAAAEGIVRVANAAMARALRVISVERGLDPRGFALLAFGGAGPLHACALADELGITQVLVPRASGVLSALGLAIADERRDYGRALPLELNERALGPLTEALAALEGQALADLPGAVPTPRADLRYRGQSFELTIDARDLTVLARRFHAEHERRYGWRQEEVPIEVVAVRMSVVREVRAPLLVGSATDGDPIAGRRELHVDGATREADVLRREQMGTGWAVHGPAIVELEGSTALVPPGWSGSVDEVGTIVLERA